MNIINNQLNIGTLPYATNFLVLDLLCTSHYMFRPRSVAIFRWFINTYKYIQGNRYIFNGSVELVRI
jgi:hypothetical protein